MSLRMCLRRLRPLRMSLRTYLRLLRHSRMSLRCPCESGCEGPMTSGRPATGLLSFYKNISPEHTLRCRLDSAYSYAHGCLCACVCDPYDRCEGICDCLCATYVTCECPCDVSVIVPAIASAPFVYFDFKAT